MENVRQSKQTYLNSQSLHFSILSFEGCAFLEGEDQREERYEIKRLSLPFDEEEQMRDGYVKKQVRIKIER